ncbi:MAG: DnaJ C-terminal domain-containing protein [Asticcacaulis sp.]|uniref:DnaJ C-terminal domain-containing protein n=1 Tax=Asticcacaulis sp. TaxID=1872648 RepID=UPI0039E6F94F
MDFGGLNFKMSGLKTRAEALEELGLESTAHAEAIRTAFRQRLKQAHPDLNGGTDARLRRLILARDLLTASPRTSSQITEPSQEFNIGSALDSDACPLPISLHQALFGGSVTVEVPALEFAAADEALTSLIQTKQLRLTVPAGLRDGTTISLACAAGINRLFRIRIQTDSDCRVWGHDIWMTARLENRIFRQGGQVLIDTPHAPHPIHIAPRSQSGASLCLKGLGLPATDMAPAGDLHVRLEACADAVRPAGHVLDDFRQRWAS